MSREWQGTGFENLVGENISNFRFVAFDTETTGSSIQADSIVELAALAFDEEFEHRTFQSLVKPPTPIPAVVVKIHGISDDMVKQAPDSKLVLERFSEFLGWTGTPRVLLAHNAGFDVGMVHGEARRMVGLSRLGKVLEASTPELVLDTCMMAKVLLPDLPQHRLSTLAEHFKIEGDRFHRAMSDVKVLQGIFLKLLGIASDRIAERGKGFSLESLIDLSGGYFILDPKDAEVRKQPFRLPPRIAALEALCGTESRVGIMYEVEQDYRYITPIAIRVKGFKVYVEAFCHRDNIKKTFRADKILQIGKVDKPEGLL